MATRANVKIVENGNEQWLYHHWDGYPEGVGSELKEYLADKTEWETKAICDDLINNIGGYEYTSGQHGDIEYCYVIDCDDKTLKCIPVDWRTGEWDDEVEIP